MYLKSHQVRNLKQHQEEEAEAVASLLLGNFHSVGLQSHVPFHRLHWLPTVCPLAHLPQTKEGEVSVICSSHGVAASTLPPSPFQALENLKTNRRRHEYAKMKLRPLEIHENFH